MAFDLANLRPGNVEFLARRARGAHRAGGRLARAGDERPECRHAERRTGAALPQTALAERNFRGQIYQTHGAGSGDFLRIAGKAAEKVILPIGPVLVPGQLPDNHPSKPVIQKFVTAFQGKFGDKSPVVFGAHSFDVSVLQIGRAHV